MEYAAKRLARDLNDTFIVFKHKAERIEGVSRPDWPELSNWIADRLHTYDKEQKKRHD